MLYNSSTVEKEKLKKIIKNALVPCYSKVYINFWPQLFIDIEIHAIKFPVHSFCADVNVREGLALCSYWASSK